MCLKLFIKTKTVETLDTLETISGILQRMAKNKTDAEMCELWFNLDQTAFHELGEIYTDLFSLTADEVVKLVKDQYPTIEDFKLPDAVYAFTTQEQMAKVIQRDFTYRVQYVGETFDCDDFADLLKSHLSLYYRISSFTLWGEAGGSSHAYLMSVLKQSDGVFKARLIEPQSGTIFLDSGPCGLYIPRTLVKNYGIFRKEGKNGGPGESIFQPDRRVENSYDPGFNHNGYPAGNYTGRKK